MSNWDGIDVRDYAGTQRTLGAQLDANSKIHPTTVPVPAMFVETTGVSLSSSDTDITIDPQANWLMIDLGTANPAGAFYLRIGVRYTTAGDFYAADIYMGTPYAMTARTVFQINQDGSTSQPWNSISVQNLGDGDNDGSRILWIPVMGAKTVRVKLDAGTLTGVAHRQFAGASPYTVTMPRPKGTATSYPDVDVTDTPYTDGDSLGDFMSVTGPTNISPAFRYAGGHVLRSISFADYLGEMPDFDIVITGAGNGESVDNDPWDPSYPEGFRAILEFRATPVAGQYQIRNYGTTGGSGGIANDLNVTLDYFARGGSGELVYFDMELVLRDAAGVTFSTDNTIYFEVVMDL